MSKTWEEHLSNKKREHEIFQGFKTYQHIERLGNEEVETLLDEDVIIETKLDGTCVSVSYWNGNFVILSRTRVISINGEPNSGHMGAIEYILQHEGIINFCKEYPNYILRSEFLKKHTLTYNPDVMNNLYVYDVQYQNYMYLHPDEYIPMLQKYNIRCIPVLARGKFDIESLVKLLEGPDEFGAKQKEGIVIKTFNPIYRNKFGRVTWGKLVHQDFKVKHKLSMGTTSLDPLELQFASYFPESIVIKNMVLAAGNGPQSIKHMGQVLKTTWHDCVVEELWNFLIKHPEMTKGKPFDFGKAHRLVVERTKDIALAIYNGTSYNNILTPNKLEQ